MDFISPLVIGIIIGGLLIAGWVIYEIGYSAGYQDGGNAALDNMADRAEHATRERYYD